MNKKNTRAFAEVTVMAVVALALPIAYIKGRPFLLQTQDQIYYKLFSVDQQQYERMKELQRHSKDQERERIAMEQQKQAAPSTTPTDEEFK